MHDCKRNRTVLSSNHGDGINKNVYELLKYIKRLGIKENYDEEHKIYKMLTLSYRVDIIQEILFIQLWYQMLILNDILSVHLY